MIKSSQASCFTFHHLDTRLPKKLRIYADVISKNSFQKLRNVKHNCTAHVSVTTRPTYSQNNNAKYHEIPYVRNHLQLNKPNYHSTTVFLAFAVMFLYLLFLSTIAIANAKTNPTCLALPDNDHKKTVDAYFASIKSIDDCITMDKAVYKCFDHANHNSWVNIGLVGRHGWSQNKTSKATYTCEPGRNSGDLFQDCAVNISPANTHGKETPPQPALMLWIHLDNEKEATRACILREMGGLGVRKLLDNKYAQRFWNLGHVIPDVFLSGAPKFGCGTLLVISMALLAKFRAD